MIPRHAPSAHARTVLLPCGRHYVTLWGAAERPATCDDCPPAGNR
ncbi:hypothetical protein ACIA59_24810 [Micromonospora haikouensis]